MTCFDANILLEIILKRGKSAKCLQQIRMAREASITALTVNLVMYYAEREGLNLKTTEQFLRQFFWLPLTESDINWAFQNYQAKDHEDALQIACALRENCKRFVTLDKALAKKYAKNIPIDLLG